MTDENIKSLIEKYLQNKCTLGEERIIEQFLKRLQENGRSKLSVYGETERELKRKIYKSLNREIHSRNRKKLFSRYHRPLMKMAATVVLLVAIGVAVFWMQKKASTDADKCLPNMICEVPYGNQKTITLSDSTTVILNSGSRLRYPQTFAQNKREVFLEGEAFFDVKHSPHDATFIVKTNGVDVVVMGTAFNVSCYDDANIETTLIRGKVMIRENTPETPNIKEFILKPGQRAVLNPENRHIKISFVNTKLYTAWTEGILLFRNSPLTEVAQKLQRWYNVDIHLESDEIKTYDYTATFENETLEEVLQVLSKITPIKYSITGNNVLLDLDTVKKNKMNSN